MARFRVDLTTRAAGRVYVEADDEAHACRLVAERADDEDDCFDDAGWTPDDEIRVRRAVRDDKKK